MRALISVSDKAGLLSFATELAARGWQLVSTGGTAKALAGAGLPVTGISDITHFPEMMDGRVKTLHPAVHGGILARRHREDDLAAIAAQGIGPIDLVVVNLYPFADTLQKPGVAFDELIENIDIGGPSMVRSAAKNFRDVLIVVSPADYPRVLDALGTAEGASQALRYELMKKAFQHTAEYDAMIAAAFSRIAEPGAALAPAEQHGEPKALRYGENPHQKAYWIERRDHGKWHVHQGKELSFTNLLDLDAALRIVLEFTEPAAAVIKHTNPCGAATASTAAEAYVAAREADSLSAFGGIVGLNRAVDAAAARALTATFIEAIIAPSIDDDAKEILAGKANLRVVTADFSAQRAPLPLPGGEVPEIARDLAKATDIRTMLGGMLMQAPDYVEEAQGAWPDGDLPKVVTKRAPTAEEWEALRFAWRVCAHVKSNAVIFTGGDRTLAVGAGQMSRVDAVNVAIRKASTLAGSVAASDAFFPFRDGIDAVAGAGATAIVQPGGSVRDAEVIAAADEHGVAMVFTGRRHFRH
ncbi:MAG: bifunctional phosphoribosylaminoimidazolecarboxamide formyltransferase/IMP cyclohydrolase [Acidobacteriota bacterium]|nr:bifunctional phosphoribosylaminoimidazolecarboxamide formyltransferase/IMP cyclohydrolase [Acidobacteriota bacterium]